MDNHVSMKHYLLDYLSNINENSVWEMEWSLS